MPLMPMILIVALALLCTVTPVSAQAQDAEADFRVMSFNIRFGTANDGEHAWPHRRAAVIGMIQRHDPDLLGVQEALAFQIDELSEALPGYAFHGVGRDDGMKRGEFCGIFVRRDRFTIEDGGHLWLSEQPTLPGSVSWDSSMTRMASWVVARDRITGRAVVFANTHFDHIGERARLESSRLIRRRLLAVPEGTAFVLAGDFNAGEGEPPYRALVDQDAGPGSGLIDAYRAAHPEPRGDEGTFSGFNAEAERGRRIDWILHNRVVETLDCTIDRELVEGVLASDHDPVIAELRYAR